ncbi:MAG: hypothetical protein CMJ42_22085 [Phyllobacteriaceae bacterium]|nr:hypothetical protein [Phyllobacteriaceae bacterium]MBA92606.1 hypothetical protein [Phyllobacteriaceae bacterium]
MELKAQILCAGMPGRGLGLVLDAPISFWGGVDPKTGRIADVRHPQHGASVAGTVLFLPGTIGSSSASAVMMELVHSGHAPAGLVMHQPDAILLLGFLTASEMGWRPPMAVKLDKAHHALFSGRDVTLHEDGTLAADIASA